MCLICATNPIDFLDDIEVLRVHKAIEKEQLRKVQAKLIKDSLDKIEHDGAHRCDVGSSIVEELKERQYAISREL